MKTIVLSVFAAGLLAGSTGVLASDRENVAVTVSTAGVDFANPDSVAAFRRQVERQIEASCNPGDRIQADLSPDFKCRREMRASLEPTVQRLAMRAKGQRYVNID